MGTAGRASFTFVHAADLHLDTPFRGVQALAPTVAAALREASLDAFDSIVDLAIGRGAAFVVIAGDIYDGAERGLRAQLRFRAGLERLAERGIPTFIVHGNHDPVEAGWSAVRSWPSGVVVFPAHAPETVEVVRDGEVIATVQGISYARPAETENLAKRLARPDGPGFAVGVLHCNVEGSPDTYAPYSPCTLADLLATGLDYLALGHIHEHRVLAGEPNQSGWVVYSGNSQARSPRRSELGAKGAVVVDVVDGAVAGLELVPCDRVRFGEIECPIDDLDDLGVVEDELVRLSIDALEASDGRSLVLRGRLTGRGALHRDLARRESLDGLVAALRDRSSTEVPFVWWDEVRDDSMAAIDVDTVRGRGDFAADLVALADARLSDADELTLLLDRIIAGAPRALQSELARVVADPGFANELTRVTSVALDTLFSEDG